MSLVDVITKIDLTIIVGIIVSHDFNRDIIDVVTIPRSWALFTFEWIRTV